MYTYLASPYSGTPREQFVRYNQVNKATAQLLNRRIPTYSPIVHCHPMSINHGLPGDAEFWLWFDKTMITQSNTFAILTLSQWEKSKGIWGEFQIAQELGRPIVFYSFKGDEVEQINDEAVPGLVASLHGVHAV